MLSSRATRSRAGHIPAGPGLQPFVQDALDEIEYVTGDPNTTWGAVRARNGHPEAVSAALCRDWERGLVRQVRQLRRPVRAVRRRDQGEVPEASARGKLRRKGLARPAAEGDAAHAGFLSTNIIINRRSRWSATPIVTHPMTARGRRSSLGRVVFDTRAPWEMPPNSLPTPLLRAGPGRRRVADGPGQPTRTSSLWSAMPLLFVNVNPGARQWTIDLIGYDALSSHQPVVLRPDTVRTASRLCRRAGGPQRATTSTRA